MIFLFNSYLKDMKDNIDFLNSLNYHYNMIINTFKYINFLKFEIEINSISKSDIYIQMSCNKNQKTIRIQ